MFVVPLEIFSGGGVGIKTSYHRHKGVSVGWVTSFVGEYFFFLAEYFFLFPSAKKKISAKKKKLSPKTKLSSNGNTFILIISGPTAKIG